MPSGCLWEAKKTKRGPAGRQNSMHRSNMLRALLPSGTSRPSMLRQFQRQNHLRVLHILIKSHYTLMSIKDDFPDEWVQLYLRIRRKIPYDCPLLTNVRSSPSTRSAIPICSHLIVACRAFFAQKSRSTMDFSHLCGIASL